VEGLAPFLIFLVIALISIISSVVKGMRQQQARQQRLRGRPGDDKRAGEYQAPAGEVRKFLESVRSDQQVARAERPPEQVRERSATGAKSAQGAPSAAGALMDMIDRAVQERQKRAKGAWSPPVQPTRPPVASTSTPPRAPVVVEQQPAREIREEPRKKRAVRRTTRKPAAKKAAPVVQKRPAAKRRRGIGLELDSVPDLRRAVIYSEILGPPRGLRPF